MTAFLRPARIILALSLLSLMVRPVAADAPAPAPLANGSFDHALQAWTWEPAQTGATAEVLAQAGLDGSNVLQIRRPAADPSATASAPARISQPVRGLTPGSRYRLAIWVSADNLRTASLFAGDRHQSLPAGTFDWTRVQIDFTAPAAPADDAPLFLIGIETGDAVDKLWISGISLTPILDQGNEIATLHSANREHLQRLEALLAAHPALVTDASTRMSLAIARRYLRRVETGGPGGTQGMRDLTPDDPEVSRWTLLQARETAIVLARAANRAEQIIAGRQTAWQMPGITGAHIAITPSGFIASAPSSENAGIPAPSVSARPVILGGYGHFDFVIEDDTFLQDLGVNLVQQERGPRDLRSGDRVSTHANALLRQIQDAPAKGYLVDFLLAPHYLPGSLFTRHPDLAGNARGGFVKYNIDHPAARSAIESWIQAIVPKAAPLPGLFAFCLSNEPGYRDSGRNPQSRPFWTAWLAEKHGTIAALNAAHGTRHASFADVPVPDSSDYPANRALLPAFYDWVQFNNEHHAGWHRWMHDLVKAAAPEAVTHAKLMPDVFDTRPQARRTHGGIPGRGIDPELITSFTDLAGCDSWSFISRDGEWSYTWQRTHLWYDLLHSFNRKPVFDSELHFIEDRHPAESIPAEQIYTILWQGALHHRTAFTSWIWQEPTGRSSLGSIYLRPANIQAASQALLDLNRLVDEITAINAAPARVALLYSPAALFWQEDYPQTTKDLYTLLTLLGHKVTFVSERQLASGNVPTGIDCLFLPRVTHTPDSTSAALAGLIRSGTTVIPVGRDNLRFDAYSRPREQSLPGLAAVLHIGLNRKVDLKTVATLVATASKSSGHTQPVSLLDAGTGARAWGIEYRDVRDAGGRRLIPLVNLLRVPVRVRLDLPASTTPVTDLISNRAINSTDFTLRPMEPLLLELRP